MGLYEGKQEDSTPELLPDSDYFMSISTQKH